MPLNYSATSEACSTPWQEPTCAAGQSGTYCAGGVDERLSQDADIDNLTMTFYEKDLPIPDTEVFTESNLTKRQENLNRATSVKVSFTLRKWANDQESAYSAERILPLN